MEEEWEMWYRVVFGRKWYPERLVEERILYSLYTTGLPLELTNLAFSIL